MNYISPIANEVAWHHAVEKLLGIELTPRCKYIRTILAELARISDHLLCVGAAALDLGAFTAFLYAFNQREKIYDIFETASGPAVPPELHPRRRPDGRRRRRRGSTRSATFVKTFPKAHADIVPAAQPQPHLRRPHQGHRRADEGGGDQPAAAPGPIARASRRASATCARTSRTWPTRTSTSRSSAPRTATASPATSSAWRRCCESLKIISQAIENLPAGPVNVDVDEQGGAARQDGGVPQHRRADPALRADHDEPAVGRRRWTRCTAAIESPNGELGFYVVGDGSGTAVPGPHAAAVVHPLRAVPAT